MDERVSFIADQRSGLWTMTELCERYEICRKTGCKWLDPYRSEGAGAPSAPTSTPSISSYCFFRVANRHTFGALFDRDLSEPKVLAKSRTQIVEMILAWLRAKA